jgi:hypothetical protein
MVERIPPLEFGRIGVLDHYIRLLEPTGTVDPDTGGWLPGPPRLVASLFAALEPTILSRLVKETLSGGAIANAENYHVTFWYFPGVNVSQYIEFDDCVYPTPADGSGVRTRHLEILEVREVQQNNRYLELLCKERVS